jgi:hypothetical protein
MQFTTVPETAKVIKFHAATAGSTVYPANLAPSLSPLRGGGDKSGDVTSLRCGGQMDCAMQGKKFGGSTAMYALKINKVSNAYTLRIPFCLPWMMMINNDS